MKTLKVIIASLILVSCTLSRSDSISSLPQIPPGNQVATFAGGCFWCIEAGFESLEGVHTVTSGFAGGDETNPTYEEVASGETGHAEAVQVIYNPEVTPYEELLALFWRYIDPTDAGGQYVDRGAQYRTIIFYHDTSQKELAEKSIQELNQSDWYDKPIVTTIEPFTVFYPAEDYHQDYYKKAPERYKQYRDNSGRPK